MKKNSKRQSFFRRVHKKPKLLDGSRNSRCERGNIIKPAQNHRLTLISQLEEGQRFRCILCPCISDDMLRRAC